MKRQIIFTLRYILLLIGVAAFGLSCYGVSYYEKTLDTDRASCNICYTSSKQFNQTLCSELCSNDSSGYIPKGRDYSEQKAILAFSVIGIVCSIFICIGSCVIDVREKETKEESPQTNDNSKPTAELV
jgi:hypothetical protein